MVNVVSSTLFSLSHRLLAGLRFSQEVILHLHLGVLHAIGVFAAVIVIGFFWRIAALCLSQSENGTMQDIGQGMAFLY